MSCHKFLKEDYKFFIQYALDETKPLPANLDDTSWQEFFMVCCRHGISGIVFDGIVRANRIIPQQVLFEWLSNVETIKNYCCPIKIGIDYYSFENA